MSKIITYINEKGGVGKTSICFNAAWELTNRGKKVLMIDMDGQRANLTFFSGIEKLDSMLTVKDIFSGVNIMDLILKVKEGLDIIPADVRVSLDMTAKVSRFRKAISSVKDHYDYIMIDVNPTPGWSHFLSLSISDYAVIVMLPDVASLEANEGIFETIEEIQESSNPTLSILGILFNKNSDRTILSRQVHSASEEIADSMDTSVFKTKIRNSVLLSENIGAHEGITDYDPKSPVADDMREFVDELERRCLDGSR